MQWPPKDASFRNLSSLFVAQRPSSYSQDNMGKFGETRGGVGKVACCSTKYSGKLAISLKRVKIDEKLPWRDYRKSPTLFRTVPSSTPYGLLPQDWGFATSSQNCNRYYLRNGQSCGLQIWPIHSQGPSEQKPYKLESACKDRLADSHL